MDRIKGHQECREVLRRLEAFPRVRLGGYPTPLQTMSRLPAVLEWPGQLLVKRDDASAFAFGGNKVRKMEFYAAAARDAGADTLITVGGLQSNHARVVAATAVRLGMRCVLIANAEPPAVLTANALLTELMGAERVYVKAREDRAPAMANLARELESSGRRPLTIPLGASTGLGALGFVLAVGELLEQAPPPDLIVHSSSSAGTTAGLLAGCALHGVGTRLLAVSADEPVDALRGEVRRVLGEIGGLLETEFDEQDVLSRCEFTDAFVGEGYGIPTDASMEAMRLCARTEALFLDQTYTAKAMAALIVALRERRIDPASKVLFWHTGGQVGLFR